MRFRCRYSYLGLSSFPKSPIWQRSRVLTYSRGHRGFPQNTLDRREASRLVYDHSIFLTEFSTDAGADLRQKGHSGRRGARVRVAPRDALRTCVLDRVRVAVAEGAAAEEREVKETAQDHEVEATVAGRLVEPAPDGRYAICGFVLVLAPRSRVSEVSDLNDRECPGKPRDPRVVGLYRSSSPAGIQNTVVTRCRAGACWGAGGTRAGLGSTYRPRTRSSPARARTRTARPEPRAARCSWPTASRTETPPPKPTLPARYFANRAAAVRHGE